VRRLTETEQAGIVRSLEKGIAASPVLSAFGIMVRVARGRFYLERQRQDAGSEPYTEVWGRITPLAGANKELLLEKPHRKGTWSEVARGQAAKLVKAIAGDTRGRFHGLGFLDASLRRLGEGQERLPMNVDDQGNFVYTDTGKGWPTPWGSCGRRCAASTRSERDKLIDNRRQTCAGRRCAATAARRR
jgi:hypothetical protein